MKCIGIEYNYTMSLETTVLKGLAADFDGDTLTILLIINKDFARAASLAFNPRNAMHISKNDGLFDNNYNQQRDIIINMNTFVQIARDNYSESQIEAIKMAQKAE